MHINVYLLSILIFSLGLLTGALSIFFTGRKYRVPSRGKIGIGASSVAGRGAFALEKINEGEVLERCPALEVRDADVGGELINYVFYGNTEHSRLVVMGYGMLFNHSFEPNVAYWLDETPTGPELVLYALRAISKGEELFYNYGKEWWSTRQGAV